MNLDHLLLWLSAKRTGSWAQFRGAVEELHIQGEERALDDLDPSGPDFDLPVYQQARLALQRLGHVEFRPSEAVYSWRVVPPSMALLPGISARGLLCGARSAALVERLHDIAEVEMLPVEGMPQRVVIAAASRHALGVGARVLGIHVQEAAPIALLSALPGVRDSSIWSEASMPETPGWTIHRFSPSLLQWTSVQQDEALRVGIGLFRFIRRYQRFYYLRWRGRSYHVPVQLGKYAVMRKRQGHLVYELARGILSVPAICRPPLLIERALILCSGLLPPFDPQSGRLEYAEVPPDVAWLAAQLLRQEV
jgi:hypothetical protein